MATKWRIKSGSQRVVLEKEDVEGERRKSGENEEKGKKSERRKREGKRDNVTIGNC